VLKFEKILISIPIHQKFGRNWLVLIVVGIGALLTAMAGLAVTIALPSLSDDMRISIDLANWVIQSFLLTVTVLLLVTGRAGDMFGHRLVYLIGFFDYSRY